MTQINTKLYIVEGPPCTGKSDVARIIAQAVAAGGRYAALFDENNMDHPADYTFHAYMTEEEIGSLPVEDRRQIYSESIRTGAGYVIPLTKISVSLFGKVLPYKIYDKLCWETERPVMLECWRSFTEKARGNKIVNVFVGSLLKNPVCETMIRFDFDPSIIKDHIKEIMQRIAPLEPAVLYLRCTDIDVNVNERSGVGKPVWLSSAVAYHETQSYCKRRGYTGLNGYVACLRERQEAELDILSGLPVRQLVLTDAHLDWAGARDAIEAFVAGKTLQKR